MNNKILAIVLLAIVGCAMAASSGHGHKNTPKPTTKPTPKPSSSHNTPAPVPPSTNLCGITATSSEPLKILVPLYVYPGAAWDTVANAAKANSNVKMIAIINPNSGPDANGPDSTYRTYMSKLTAAGVDMVGYVHTTYGDRASGDVYADIDNYASKYPGLKGIFIDEASAAASELSYYQGVYNRITGHSGYVNAILNPGTQPDQGYLAVSTNLVIFEDAASKLKSSFASWVTCAPNSSQKPGYKYHFSGIAYGASSGTISTYLATMKNSGMGMVYLTDGAAGCCTYNALTTYFGSLASAVAALN